MNKLLTASTLLLLLACHAGSGYSKAEDAQDAGRQFIRASLDGDYDKARFYLLSDSTNQLLLDTWKKDYARSSEEVQQGFKNADILPIHIVPQNDSVTMYCYANSYKKDTSTIRIVRINGEWLVDLKEILNHK
jgi:hypothetical protein